MRSTSPKSIVPSAVITGSDPSVTVALSTAPVTTGASLVPVMVMVSEVDEVAPLASAMA